MDKAMSKSEIVNHFATKFNVSRKEAAAIVAEFTELAVTEVKKSGVFAIPGIGKMIRKDRPARTARNPRTGESVKVPAKTVVKIRLSKKCKEMILN